jgi:hypothetical protein
MVVMIIFLPPSKLLFKSAEEYAGATIFFTSENSLMFSRNCLSNNLLSVTTITESNKGLEIPLLPGIESFQDRFLLIDKLPK